jgi:hypothetical protein
MRARLNLDRLAYIQAVFREFSLVLGYLQHGSIFLDKGKAFSSELFRRHIETN